MKARHLFLIIAISMAAAVASAYPIFRLPRGAGDEPPRKKPQISKYHPRLLAGSECEKILMSAEERLSRDFTVEEIEAALPKILERTGESLLPEPEPPPLLSEFSDQNKRETYFHGASKVLTGNGYVEIDQLDLRSHIMSYDFKTKMRIPNRPVRISKRKASDLAYLKVDLHRPLMASLGTTFFDTNGVEMSFITHLTAAPAMPFFSLASMGGPTGSQIALQEIKVYRPVHIEATDVVYSIELEHPPYNLIVEGFIVEHDKDSRW